MLDLLLKYKANMLAMDAKGKSPLQLLGDYCGVEVEKELTEKSAPRYVAS